MINPICGACPLPARTHLPGQSSYPARVWCMRVIGGSWFLLFPEYARKILALLTSNKRERIESDVQ